MSGSPPATAASVPAIIVRQGLVSEGERAIPEEVPVAFSYSGSTHAVMMATPDDLEDFAVGFSLTEGIVRSAVEIEAVDVVEAGNGLDLQIVLRQANAEALSARRRQMAGPVGCGMCGIESIDQAMRVVPSVSAADLVLSLEDVTTATSALQDQQRLNRRTRAVHGAGFYLPGQGMVAVREDVGRHNALDKLIGAIALGGWQASAGAIVVTSRLSVEMVQKAAIAGSPVLIAISAPTTLAVRTASEAGMTLVAIARDEDCEVFTRPDRLNLKGISDVA
ncbi:formate dehydrogenase accessory sulfurtransferase FdhD [Peteryoungia ipomoeae]|uniref:formate dehydrogenase accessory sulfurtransferase FdhD n=1 Tax=Peteryoungia ipomoeae TaxID=1210932 RepID=UPI001FE91CF2|nr:formate dehydrogenase accessory sulfurtransferase FdhD [Peteryoungia ipomoeae]